MPDGGKHSVLQPGNLLIIQERERLLARLLRRLGYDSLEDVRVFEAGCAGGYNLRMFVQWGARPENVAGIDLDAESVAYCRTHASDIRVHHGSADRIPEPDHAIDIALAFTLFSSVPDLAIAIGIADELVRVSKPGGTILLYDMRRPSPTNRSVHRIKDKDVRQWFVGCKVHARSITLAPPIARRIGRRAPWLYGPLAKIPFLRTHRFYVIRVPG
jgi:SAM-dependent methyltransferase